MPTTVTKTVKSAGGDYTTLSGWEAGEQLDLVSNDKILQAECYALTDTTEFAINGWTTDATRYIRIYVANGEGHSGYYDSSKFLFHCDNAAGFGNYGIEIFEDYVRLEGLQLQLTSSNGSGLIGVRNLAAASEVRIQKCLFKGIITGSDGRECGFHGFDDTDGNAITKLINCVFWDFTIAAFPHACYGIFNKYGDVRAYNCTFYGCGTGFGVDGTTFKGTAVNCLSYCDATDTARTDFSASANFQNSSNNASTDGTAPGTSALTNQASTDIDFLSTTSTNASFLAIDSTSTCVGAGTDDPLAGVYADDIRGETRTSTWDIGADEYVAAAAGSNHRIIGGGWGGRAISQRMMSR